MVFNTITVGGAVTPAVLSTFLSHYLNRKPLAQKPTAHISYDEGLHLIRKFLYYASHHTVEDIQRFTSQWVPHPRWVKVDEVQIPEEHLLKAAEALHEQLGHHGVQKVGGKTWWQWRRPGSEMKAEWIEMRADYHERKNIGQPSKRVMLYVHGGAYFFGSVDEHRYQMQRHARKLKARVFARQVIARYRLAPQFPFPCGIQDCMAAYLYLLTVQDPTTIILAGDSAGGGMVLSMLVIMRDKGIPLPAGAILISPWVDLTHSFPSVAGDNPLDYIPPHGFHQRPSPSWPPPNSDDILAIEEGIVKKLAHNGHAAAPMESEADAVQGFHVDHNPEAGMQNDDAARNNNYTNSPMANTVPGSGHDLSIMIDGKLVQIKDQIQMYATNQLISHPLVSPALQPSLGGLPPLLIQTGGGEMLRDEQIYLAHKAANPTKYPPGDAFLDEVSQEHNRDQIGRWKPTDVQLQVWEDLCHVAPTLSFTRPAKYMYRSIAQFGAWALARAQKTEIEILDDDDVSVISQSDSDDEGEQVGAEKKSAQTDAQRRATGQVGKAGDSLPAFKNHMIRQRVDRYGNIYELEPASELAGCNVPINDIGVIKEGPVRKWMAAKREWDTKYASAKRSVQKKRAKEMAQGYQEFGNGEVPPPSALAGRRKTGEDLREEKKKKSWGMGMWAMWGSKHDEQAIKNEQEADKAPETSLVSSADGAGARALHDTKEKRGQTLGGQVRPEASRSRSRRRTVVDEHQTDSLDVNENAPAAALLAMKSPATDGADGHLTPELADSTNPAILVRTPTSDDTEYDLKRPKAGGIAFPFSVKGHSMTASMTTLTSVAGVHPAEDVRTAGALNSGVPQNAQDVEALATTIRGASGVLNLEKGKEPAAEPAMLQEIMNGGAKSTTEHKSIAGENISAERPALETFVTAPTDLPTLAKNS